MKNLLTNLFAFALVAVLFLGCEKGKPLNKECDVLNVTLLETEWLVNVSISNDEVVMFVKDTADMSALTPIIEITSGATITPSSETTHNFADERVVKYILTSEDGNWSKEYIFRATTLPDIKTLTFDFNDWDLVESKGGNYWNPAGYWASGNPGIAVLRIMTPDVNKRPAYPTMWTDTVGDVKEGKAALLINQRGFGPPAGFMVPGSVFLGRFNTLNALKDPLSCPQFGMPVFCTKSHKPTKFIFDYMYKPGDVYINELGEIQPNLVDKCNIYAVIFTGKGPLTPREISNKGFLGERIIAYAQLEDRGNSYGWKHIEQEFTYRNVEWNASDVVQIAIVITASIEGDLFKGAIGSKLVIDNVLVR